MVKGWTVDRLTSLKGAVLPVPALKNAHSISPSTRHENDADDISTKIANSKLYDQESIIVSIRAIG